MVHATPAPAATPAETFIHLALDLGGNLITTAEAGAQLAGIIWEIAQDADPDTDLLADIRDIARPHLVGQDVADAITNLLVSISNRAECDNGNGWQFAYPEARGNHAKARRIAADTVAGALAELRTVLSAARAAA